MIDPVEIRLATPADVARIFEAFYAVPRPFLYTRSVADLDRIRERGQLVCTVETRGAGRVLTSSYIQPAAADDCDGLAQLGGGIVHERLRRTGIMRLIGALSLAHWLRFHPGTTIESRVVAANREPIRPLLESLGFVCQPELLMEDPAEHAEGMRHWPRDEQGRIPVERWHSTVQTADRAVELIRAFPGYVGRADDRVACSIARALEL
ncbi:MAG: hypothetical protein IT355_06255 [Gemmatimonadaceae bacterium]|nr:hypothetical protein [Gemmatimonadaceae bacterium]